MKLEKIKKLFRRRNKTMQVLDRLNKEDVSLRVLGRLASMEVSSYALMVAVRRHKERFGA